MNERKASDPLPSIITLEDDEQTDRLLYAMKRMIDAWRERYASAASDEIIKALFDQLRVARKDTKRIDAMSWVYSQRAAPTIGIREVTFKMPTATDPDTLLPMSFRKVLDLFIKARAL